MKMKVFFSACCTIGFCLLWLSGCKKNRVEEISFTKADSLTETYLALQDTMLQAWNTIIHDDNRKLGAMNHLLHELNVTRPEKRDELQLLQERIDNLKSLRYDRHTMSDTELVSEYDFASRSLTAELVAIAEAQREFAYNPTLQKLVDSIRAADERVHDHREEYDRVAARFNEFIDRNRTWLHEIVRDSGLRKKPLFEMAAE